MSSVGDNLNAKRGGWDFGEIDHDKFEDHISKSVPGYETGHQYITFLSDYFVHSNSTIYDIGCSTGNLISKLSDYNKNKDALEFVGIDSVKDFEVKFYSQLSNQKNYTNHSFEFINSNVEEMDFKNCDLVISYYTMQFIPPKFRQDIINMIYSKLNWGGGFFFFEKVRGIDARFHEMINMAYLEYKSLKGYSNDEIISKMFSLKGILEPYSSNENNLFLKRAGFKDVSTISKNLCFEGLLAIK